MRFFQSTYYVPNNAALVVAGDVDVAQVRAMAAELLGDWPTAADPFEAHPRVTFPALRGRQMVYVDKPSQVTARAGSSARAGSIESILMTLRPAPTPTEEPVPPEAATAPSPTDPSVVMTTLRV